MCKIGDIILIDKYIGIDNTKISRHSFIIMDNNGGQIAGLDYNFVTTVLSSFKNENHKLKKLKYKTNIEYDSKDIKFIKPNGKTGYIKSDELHYFKKNKIKYQVIGKITIELYNFLRDCMIQWDNEGILKINTNNLN